MCKHQEPWQRLFRPGGHDPRRSGAHIRSMNKYIIYSPIYRDNSGGIIVLHKLCAMLLDKGIDAKIWPDVKPHINDLASKKGIKLYLRWCLKYLPKYAVGSLNIKSPYNLPIARTSDIKDAIVIYPEITFGNPLRAKKVVRWLLNKPGVLTGEVNYGSKDLLLYFHEQFNDWQLNPNKQNHLRVIELMSDVYRKINTGERIETCYMVRKGKNRNLDQHDDNAIQVDRLSHKQMAEVFNRCKYFVSYDLYTMYSRYAAMCGCIPIVIPEPGMVKEQWRPEVEFRYGIAYGWDDIPWAIETRGKLLEHIDESASSSRKSVDKFVEISQAYFASVSSKQGG